MKINRKNFLENIRKAISHLEEGRQLSGGELASFVSAITALEIEEGGPYVAMDEADIIDNVVVSGGSPADLDIELNLLIAYFLSLCEISLPKLDAFLDERISEIKPISFSVEELDHFATRWQATRGKVKEDDGDVSYASDEQQIIDMIVDAAEKRFGKLSSEIKEFAMREIQKTISGNLDKQMSLMAYYTKKALGAKAASISDDLVAQMGLANIFFWTAFIIYDDFWDEDEAADPRILPVANLYARSYVDFFDNVLPQSSGFGDFFHKLMDGLDGANTWETVHCRTKVNGAKFTVPRCLPDYGDYEMKYLPACGHILGPVAILVKLGYDIDSPEVKNLISYFRNYLIAMQINDDAHDWEEDMRRGHLSTVVVMLLEDFGRKGGEVIDLDSPDLLELKKTFWFKTIARAEQTVLAYTQKSRQALESLTELENMAPLERMINLNENAAKKALKEQKDSMEFLAVYKG